MLKYFHQAILMPEYFHQAKIMPFNFGMIFACTKN